MKMHILFLILFLSLILNQDIRAQEFEIGKEDSLAIFLEKKDFNAYFKKIGQISDSAFALSDAKTLFFLSELIKQDFGFLTSVQKRNLREEAMRLGFNIQKLTGYVKESLSVYLIAHQNVENKRTLDKLSWYIENVIANFYTKMGDYEQAEYYDNLLKESLKHFNLIERLSRYYTNHGTKLQSQFKYEEAKINFERGFYLADSINDKKGIFANSLKLAKLFNENPHMGSPATYLINADSILPSFVSDKRYLEMKSELDFETASYLYQQDKCNESILKYNEAIEDLAQYYPNTRRREFAKLYTSLAIAYFHCDSLEMAIESTNLGFASLIPDFNEQNELPMLSQLYPENSFMDLLELKAIMYEKRFLLFTDKSFLNNALESLMLALDVNDMIRETVIADPSKLVSIRSNKDLIEKGISIVYQLNIVDDNNAYFDKARTLFNRSKALLYTDKTLRSNLIGIFSTPDKENWIAIQDSLTKLREDKFNEGVDINLINGKILAFQKQIEEIFTKYNSGMLNASEPERYIEYFMSEEYIYSLSVMSDQHRFLKIGLVSDFQKLVERLHSFIKNKAMSDDKDILKDLYNFLIQPVADQLPDHLVIIPDGSIGFVPFEMLIDNHQRYLIESSTVSYSFEFITYQNNTDIQKLPFEIFCLAPRYKVKLADNSIHSRGNLYDLPYAKMEVDSILSLYDSSTLKSHSGDKNDLDQKLSQTHIFHYAGHAIINNDKAFLALNVSRNEREQLTSDEIGYKHYSLDLVVLSACETGLGKMETGEGIRSLGRSFMESGAKSTVISLWNVNDKSTALIMTSFYKYLKKGIKKDDALRLAKLDYMKNAKTGFGHPYFWAAFIPAGNMTAL